MSNYLNIGGYLKTLGQLLFLLMISTATCADDNEVRSIHAERYRQAGHPATTSSIFESLSLDDDVSIRRRVASNRKTPKNILLRLAKDSAQSVKIAIATNLSAGENVYPILARDKMLAVRSVVARFEYVPIVALEILAKDNEVDIRLEVARNLNSSKNILLLLSHDKDDSVKSMAEQALQRLRDDK
jgi:hypothetical protein